MRLMCWVVTCALAASLAGCDGRVVEAAPKGPGATTSRPAGPNPRPSPTVGVWQPGAGLQQTPIWPGAAPDAVANPRPESVGPPPGREWWPRVNDVSRPTMTVYPARGRNTGAAVVVFPGGGFMFLAMDSEGTEICDWLSAKGVTCILAKYRVPESDHHFDEACDCAVTPPHPLALQDAQRTIRLVRSRAKALGIDPARIGVMGFSAGGYLAARTSNIFEPAYKPVDAIDQVSSRPDFAVVVYPGHLCRAGGVLDPSIHVTKRTSPTFLLAAWDDPVDDPCNSTVYAKALQAGGAEAEVHLFAKGGHAFGLRHREQRIAIWPSLVESWLKRLGIL